MQQLRLFPKHTGIWEGTYRRISPAGELIDEWKSRLTIRMLPPNQYQQVNEYLWEGGHYECHDFGLCEFDESGTLHFNSPRISGEAWETRNSVCLIWDYKDRPGSRLYEMIDLIGPEEKHRVRVWKWTYHNEFEGITMIQEHKVAEESEIDPNFWDALPTKRFKGKSRSNR